MRSVATNRRARLTEEPRLAPRIEHLMRILPCSAPPLPIEPAPLTTVLESSVGWSCFWGADGGYYARRVSAASGRGARWYRIADEAIVVERDDEERPAAPVGAKVMMIGGRARQRRWARLVTRARD